MKIVLIVHDVRSCHNVGSLLRTAEGIGVEHVYLTGYTPYPASPQDSRLPHLRDKLAKQIHKTALGAEDSVPWSHQEQVETAIQNLKAEGYQIIALEQTPDSVLLPLFRPHTDIALLIGREVEGIDTELLALCDTVVEIPMAGRKESFNVVKATAMAL
jgi:tRNA G18 (ribose-2'-O)-methylase SpoU